MIDSYTQQQALLLKHQAESLCESHSGHARDELLQRIFCTVMRLLPKKQAKKVKRASLVELLQNSSYEGVPTVIAKGDSVFISGNFDINQLCAQIVWKDTVRNVDLSEEE
jgi:hypothetical protein